MQNTLSDHNHSETLKKINPLMRREMLKKNPWGKCNRNSRLKNKYSINLLDYTKILHEQDFKCKICGKKHAERNGQRLCVDHCHTTGAVRGLLCSHCNSMIGFAKENIETMKNGIKYLEGN